MEKKFIHFSTYYDKELLRQAVILLNEHNLKYHIENKESASHARAPLSVYFEADLFISEEDFEKADQLLKENIP